MHQVAEQVLHDVLHRYGSTSCDTPQIFEKLLHKYGRSAPQDIAVLCTVLRQGVIKDLRSGAPVDRASLSRVLVLSAKLSPDKADWAIQAWADALAKAPSVGTGPASGEAAARTGSLIPAIAIFSLAVAAGAAAYFLFLH